MEMRWGMMMSVWNFAVRRFVAIKKNRCDIDTTGDA
jgi:hypothetical protein